MKITNDLKLPEALFNVIKRDEYSRGDSDYSITELLSPARQQAILKTHGHKITKDVSQLIYAFLGKTAHSVFEKARVEGDVTEHRLSAKISGKRISGQFDRFTADNTLVDLKIMSVWEVIYGLRTERIEQLNAYKFLAELNGIKVDRMMVLGILRDWSKGEADRRKMKNDTDYPQNQVVFLEIPDIGFDKTQALIKARIAEHEKARNTPNWLPECNAEERWETPTNYALTKPSRKSALRVMQDKDDLMAWAIDHSFADTGKDGRTKLRAGVNIEVRTGQSIRCARYCDAFEFCEQGKKLVAASDAPATEQAA